MSLSSLKSEIIFPYFQSVGDLDPNSATDRVATEILKSGAGVKAVAASIQAEDLIGTELPLAIRKALAIRIREDAIATVEVTTGDTRKNLRPGSFDDVIGHADFKRLMSNAITAARKQGVPLRHILLNGPRGLGKTTLALVIANELKAKARLLVGSQLRTPVDITNEVLRWEKGSVVFIDEIHGMSRAAQETLYSVMEDGRLPITEKRKGHQTKTSVPAPSITIIGATTNPSKLLEPFRNRFGSKYELGFYSNDEMKKIGQRSASILGLTIEPSAVQKLVAHCRDNPRTLNEFLLQLNDLSIAQSLLSVTVEHVSDLLKLNGYDEQGLRPEERRYVEALKTIGGSGSLKTIAETLDMEVSEVEGTIERWLVRKGMIRRTPKGRQIIERS
ncbi:AAA family ATPase [Candidatus Uhrbacteria bacterium]|nr:AAA family ATPase [Candidatus Uhrbacteria bacterium]